MAETEPLLTNRQKRGCLLLLAKFVIATFAATGSWEFFESLGFGQTGAASLSLGVFLATFFVFASVEEHERRAAGSE